MTVAAGPIRVTSSVELSVMKIGGSVLSDRESFDRAADETVAELGRSSRVVVVVSARQGCTDRLIGELRRWRTDPESVAATRLLASGEQDSVVRLAAALTGRGLSVASLDGASLGLVVAGSRRRARPIRLVSERLRTELAENTVVVVPGFVGRHLEGGEALLGRGGSDLSAIWIASELDAEHCVLVKDVAGWFDADPAEDPTARLYRRLTWNDACAVPAPIVQERAVDWARRNSRPFEIRELGAGPEGTGTRIGPGPTGLLRASSLAVGTREGVVVPVVRPFSIPPGPVSTADVDGPGAEPDGSSESELSVSTRLVQRPGCPDDRARASSTPIYQTATFAVDEREAKVGTGYDYSRSGNPTRTVLEQQLADLEGAHRSLVYSSGVAALAAVLRLAPRGRSLLVGRDLYGGTLRLLDLIATERGIRVRLADADELVDPGRWPENLGLVLVESPTNPRMEVVDLGRLARAARSRGARLAVDNTMLSPLRQRPLADGADFSVQSATKLLGGHGDLTAGVVSVGCPELGAALSFRRNAEGTALAPFECWLLLRGIETLAVRLDRQLRTARHLVRFLRSHPAVDRVHHPRDRSRQGPVISFELGRVDTPPDVVAQQVQQVLHGCRLFRPTVSFGGTRSSICHPSAMSHASVPTHWRRRNDLPAGLLRLSVGLEAASDLEADLRGVLDAASVSGAVPLRADAATPTAGLSAGC